MEYFSIPRAYNCKRNTSNRLGIKKFLQRSKHIFLIANNNICFVIAGGKTPDVGSRTYPEIMREQLLKGEELEVNYLNLITFYLF